MGRLSRARNSTGNSAREIYFLRAKPANGLHWRSRGTRGLPANSPGRFLATLLQAARRSPRLASPVEVYAETDEGRLTQLVVTLSEARRDRVSERESVLFVRPSSFVLPLYFMPPPLRIAPFSPSCSRKRLVADQAELASRETIAVTKIAIWQGNIG